MTKLKLNLDKSKKEELLKRVSEEAGVKIEVKEDNSAIEEIKPKTPIPPKRQPIDFDEIYKKLHTRSPKVFNLENPVMFARQIHKKIQEFTELNSGEVRFWVGKYMRKSKYYKRHIFGAPRYNFDGEEVGVVSEEEANKVDELFKSQFKKKSKKEESENNS